MSKSTRLVNIKYSSRNKYSSRTFVLILIQRVTAKVLLSRRGVCSSINTIIEWCNIDNRNPYKPVRFFTSASLPCMIKNSSPCKLGYTLIESRTRSADCAHLQYSRESFCGQVFYLMTYYSPFDNQVKKKKNRKECLRYP